METINLKSKTVCFVDNGLFCEFARKLAPSFKKAYYYVPTNEAFVSVKKTKIGEGVEELQVTHTPLTEVDNIDLWVFLDIGCSDLQQFLAERGARVTGARFGEELETERAEVKQYFLRKGLSVIPYEVVVGIERLRSYLQTKKNKWVKAAASKSLGRADMESWEHVNYTLSCDRLNELQYNLGPLGSKAEFLVEDKLTDCLEIGYDGSTVDGAFPSVSCQGLEIKGLGLVGHVKKYEELAKPVVETNKALREALKGYQYRGPFAMEILCDKKGHFYPSDPCTRLGSPSNELLQEIFTGWPEHFWAAAEGKLVDLKPVAKYGFIVMVYRERSDILPTCIQFPKEMRKWIKFRNFFVEGEEVYILPQGQPQNLAGVVALGDTVEAAAKAVEERAEAIKGMNLDVAVGAVSKAQEAIKKAAQFGIQF